MTNKPLANNHLSAAKLGDKNPQWKGDKVNLISLHEWVGHRLKKPLLCPDCNKKPVLDLANISDKYNPETYNRELKNWMWLCRRCHMVRDGRINNLRPAKHRTICTKGHPLTGENLIIATNSRGYTKVCRICKNNYQRERYRRIHNVKIQGVN